MTPTLHYLAPCGLLAKEDHAARVMTKTLFYAKIIYNC